MISYLCPFIFNTLAITGNDSYIFYFDIAALACLLVLGVLYISRKNFINRANKIFLIMFASTVISSAFDLVSAFTIPLYDSFPLELNYLFSMIFYLSFSSMGVLFLIYVIEISKKGKKNLFEKIIIVSVFAFNFIVILSTPFTKWLFYFGENGYDKGSMIYVVYGLSAFTLIYAISLFIINIKKSNKMQLLAVSFFSVAMASSVIIQIIDERFLIENFVLALFLILVYFNLQTPDYYINKYCECFNAIALDETIKEKYSRKEHYSMVAFTIDDFSILVQTIGKENESKLLKQIGGYIRKKFGTKNVYGLRDGRFVILTSNQAPDYNTIIKGINEFFALPIDFEKISINVNPYFCVFNCPSINAQDANIIDVIDYSIDNYKLNKQSGVYIANNELIDEINRENAVAFAMKNALKTNKGFEVYYQPIFDCKTNKFTSIEALLRFKDEALGNVSPSEFIPIAERNGLVIDVDKTAFHKVLDFVKATNIEQYGINCIEFNLSMHDFKQHDLGSRILKLINDADINPSLFNFEITESAEKTNEEELKNIMSLLVENGCSFSMDDYGTGYSTTKYIIELPFDIIKIDKSIIFAAMESQKGLMILEYLVHSINVLNKKIVVEGVENVEMINLLKKLGCYIHQGFYYSRPLPADELVEFLKKNNK